MNVHSFIFRHIVSRSRLRLDVWISLSYRRKRRKILYLRTYKTGFGTTRLGRLYKCQHNLETALRTSSVNPLKLISPLVNWNVVTTIVPTISQRVPGWEVKFLKENFRPRDGVSTTTMHLTLNWRHGTQTQLQPSVETSVGFSYIPRDLPKLRTSVLFQGWTTICHSCYSSKDSKLSPLLIRVDDKNYINLISRGGNRLYIILHRAINNVGKNIDPSPTGWLVSHHKWIVTQVPEAPSLHPNVSPTQPTPSGTPTYRLSS